MTNVNLTSLPCPLCGKPAPIEARLCTCGRKFLRTSSSEEQRSLALVPLPEPNHRPVAASVASEPPIRTRRIVFTFAIIVAAFVATFLSDGYHAADIKGLVANPADQPAPLAIINEDKTVISAYAQPVRPGLDKDEGSVSQPLAEVRSLRLMQAPERYERTEASHPAPVVADTRDPSAADGRAKTEGSPVAEKKPNSETAAAARRNAVPTARCSDGTYSYSSSGDNACSERGGIAKLLGKQSEPPRPISETAVSRTHHLGPRGGCYYINGKGAKIYVKDKRLCGDQ